MSVNLPKDPNMDGCAFDKNGKCIALTVRDCEDCPFRKTHQELFEGRWRASARLDRLSPRRRKALLEKYYK